MEALLKILVMAHELSRGSAVNVTKKTKHHLFLCMQLLRQTNPHHVQLRLFDENKWNNNCDGSRRKELSAVDYGL